MLRQKIEEWGYRCFCDHYDIGPGMSWEESILDALRQSVALVVFASPAAMESKWVFAEIHIARYAKKPIFFLVTDRDTQIPPHLTTIQFIDASNRSGGLAFLDQLRQALPQHPTHAPQHEAGSQQALQETSHRHGRAISPASHVNWRAAYSSCSNYDGASPKGMRSAGCFWPSLPWKNTPGRLKPSAPSSRVS